MDDIQDFHIPKTKFKIKIENEIFKVYDSYELKKQLAGMQSISNNILDMDLMQKHSESELNKFIDGYDDVFRLAFKEDYDKFITLINKDIDNKITKYMIIGANLLAMVLKEFSKTMSKITKVDNGTDEYVKKATDRLLDGLINNMQNINKSPAVDDLKNEYRPKNKSTKKNDANK